MAPPVVGGHPVEAGKWPSIAAPFYNGLPTCTGVLVAPTVVLTAGHCDSVSLDAVLIGAEDRSELESGEFIAVAEHIVHERPYDTYDLTVVLLEQEAQAEPTDLAIGCASGVLVDEAQAWVVGYGATDTGGSVRTDLLHEVLLPVTDADCDDPAQGCNPEVSPEGELIAGGEGLDSCVGDSGGPLFVVASNGKPYLAGITSRAAIPASTPCGDGGIYVRVDAVRSWVEEVSGVGLPEPDCDGLNNPPAPEDATLSLLLGEEKRLTVPANDPDAGQDHSWAVITQPELVEAWFEGSELVLSGLQVGQESLTIEVSDGELSGRATVDLRVVAAHPPEALYACSTSPARRPWAALLLVLIGAGLSRRRSGSQQTAELSARRPRPDRSAGSPDAPRQRW